MEISTDPDGRVYVRWHDGGAFTVLDRDRSVHEEFGLGGAIEWGEWDPDREGESYREGYEAGQEAEKTRLREARRAQRAAKAGA